MNREKVKSAISPTREENFPEWYQQVIKAADLAENAQVRGCMVIKPWGYGLWERIQRYLDRRIKETGHENAYFPLFIPISFMEKEAEHVSGFAKECAVVTHHRLEEKEGKLIPTGELQEPMIVRPTSEMIIGDSFSRWIESWRDLPLKINQWANVVRWEMRPRIFLRTTEFLWQEGHTAHATHKEAVDETLQMLGCYQELYEEVLAIPTIPGEKSAGERFPGAENTYTLEVMMHDRKALQGCTSHFLGQNFAKAQGIMFNNQEGQNEHAYTTSWGLTTRTIGALIMVHGDDDGLRLPPRIAQRQVVILPITPSEETKGSVLEACEKLKREIEAEHYFGESVSCYIDSRDKRGGDKSWEWIKKGVPIRIEVGPKDLEKNEVTLYRRDMGHKERHNIALSAVAKRVPELLNEIQNGLFQEAKAHMERHIYTDITTFEQLKNFFTPKNAENPEIHGGFVRAKWCGEKGTEELLKPLNLTIRCLPIHQTGTKGHCILTGKEATIDVIIAKAY